MDYSQRWSTQYIFHLSIYYTHILLTRWRYELQNHIQGLNESVDEYARSIKKLIKQVEADGQWSESSKIHEFTKGLRYNITMTANNLIGLHDDKTLIQAIYVARRIESNLQGFTNTTQYIQFATTPIAIPVLTTQTTHTNNKLIEKMTARIAKILEPLV